MWKINVLCLVGFLCCINWGVALPVHQAEARNSNELVDDIINKLMLLKNQNEGNGLMDWSF